MFGGEDSTGEGEVKQKAQSLIGRVTEVGTMVTVRATAVYTLGIALKSYIDCSGGFSVSLFLKLGFIPTCTVKGFTSKPTQQPLDHSDCWMTLIFLILSRCGSTIHGRIDQVNQLLELDYQKRGGARYTALDKWTNQLNTLNQAIVSKLTWWRVHDQANGMLQIHLNYVSALEGFPNNAILRKITEASGIFFLYLLCADVEAGNYWHFVFLLIGPAYHVLHANASDGQIHMRKRKHVHSLVLYTVHC